MNSSITMFKPTDNSHSKSLGREHYYIKLHWVCDGYRWSVAHDTLTPDQGDKGWEIQPKKTYRAVSQAISEATKARWRITLD